MPITLAEPRKPIPLRTRRYGVVQMRRLTNADIAYITEMTAERITHREFAARLIHHQIDSPTVELAEVRAWDRRLLIRAARTWTTGPHNIGRGLPPDMPPLAGFRHIVLEYLAELEERRQRMQEQLREMISPAGTVGAQIEALTGWPDIISQASKIPLITQNVAFEAARRITGALGYAAAAGRAFQGFMSGVAEIVGLLLAMRDRVVPVLSGLVTAYDHINVWVNSQVQPVITQIRSAIPGWMISGSLLPNWDIEAFIRSLPDPEQLQRMAETYDRGERVLDAAGLGFTVDVWDYPVYVWLARLNVNMANNPHITRGLLEITRGPAFEEELRKLFCGSPRLRRWWPNVEEVLDNHRRDNFRTSINQLAGQIEGRLGDGLIVRGQASDIKGQLYVAYMERPSRKRIQRDKDNKRVKYNGLLDVIDKSHILHDPMIGDVARVVREKVWPIRNPALHGRRVFKDARTSVLLILLLWMVARWVVAEERKAAQAAQQRRRLN